MCATKIVKYGHDGVYAFDQGMVRALLIMGKERALLFDAGVEKTDLMSRIKEVTDLPVELCLSHSDHDHTANISAFPHLYLHEDEAERLRKNCAGDLPELRIVKEDDEFDLGGRVLRVLHCPGHTPGSISLLDAGNGILFSGDTVSYGPVYMFGDGRDMEAYIKTLEMLWDIYEKGDFADVYPCHNICPIDGASIEDLIHCAKDLEEGVLPGMPTSMMAPGGEPVLEYHVGDCGIFHV